MTEVVHAQGNFILTHENCRFCNCPSQAMHPSGVVSQRWTCTRCGFRQDGLRMTVGTAEEFKRSRKSEATS